MNVKLLLSILLTASLAGNAAFLLSAFGSRPARAGAGLEQLALTQAQTSTFEGPNRAFQAERARAHQKMGELRGVLADEFSKQAPDREKVSSATAEMARVQAGMRPKVIDNLLALHGLLSPEQRAILANIMRAGGGSGAVCPGAMLYSPPGQGR